MGKYEEALERARAGKPIDEVFLELKESEDERIRKGLLFFIKKEREKKHLTWDKIPLDDYEAYLEKQKDKDKCPEYCVRSHCIGCPIYEKRKEQQPSTEETELNSIAFLEQMGYTCIPPGKEQRPAEWSDEDKTIIDCAVEVIEKAGLPSLAASLKSLENRGKSPKSNTNSPS